MKNLKTKRKLLYWVLAVFAGIALLASGILFYFLSDPWGFARDVEPAEEAARLALIASAQQWLGANEADGSHEEIIDLYNSHEPLAQDYTVQYTDSWCAVFVSAAAIASQETIIIPTECGCQRQIELFAQMGCWQEDDNYLPLPGDIIYYSWGKQPLFSDCTGWSNHVGIVVGTAGPFIKVIEGNKNDRVAYRYILRGYYQIRGYGLPDYGST